jgi:c-di-GMP-binding flagellar brake protein YcgR
MNKFTMNQQITNERKMGVFTIEKRRHPRYNVELPFDYSRIEGKETYGGIVGNASEGGLLVYLPQRMEIGAVLKIEIFCIQGLELNTIKTIAKVVWSDIAAKESFGEYRYGLQFLYIEEKDFAKLLNLLKEIGK